MTSLTRRIAAELGPTLVAVSISETINLEISHDVHPTPVYLNGLLFLVGGLVIITSHNQWRTGRSFLVTLSGWLLVLAGGYRMFFPIARQLGPGLLTYGVIALLGVLGLALCVVAAFKDWGLLSPTRHQLSARWARMIERPKSGKASRFWS